MNAAATTTTSSCTFQRRRCIAQSFLLIWVDKNIDQESHVCQYTLEQLRSIVDDVNIFTQADECVDFLTAVDDLKVFLIVSSTMGQRIVPLIHDIPQLDSVYIFCGSKTHHEAWIKNWVKIKSIHTEVKSICEALQIATKQCNQNSISVSFVSMNEIDLSENLSRLEPSFMYTQIFKEILLEMDYSEQAMKDFVQFWRNKNINNTVTLNRIAEFERDYRPSSSIWWYTRETFLYTMINSSLRLLDTEAIMKMGFFVRDLHCQIEEIHKQHIRCSSSDLLIVYRGQGLSETDFKKLQQTRGGLMSFNNFLSTSNDREVSFGFAEGALSGSDMVGILFQISIDPTVSSTPFASICEFSYFENEGEILFSMHTVFRVGEIQQTVNNSHLWEVQLTLTDDNDPQLATLTIHMREATQESTGWYRMGRLMCQVGHFHQAEELYNRLLKSCSSDSDRSHIYNQLGLVKTHEGEYKESAFFYEKSLEINRKTLPEDNPTVFLIYSNIGVPYNMMGDYLKALEFFKKTLKIGEKTLPPNHLLFAVVHGRIGQVYKNMGDYSKALEFHEKALKIEEKALPTNHPSLATAYDSIGQVCHDMGDYSKAVEFYEKALKIEEKALPPNHPSFATAYNNIGQMCHDMGDYSKALQSYEKALGIYGKSLSPNLPELSAVYSNIGQVYNKMSKHSKALEFYEKTLTILQKTLPVNHPSWAVSHGSIAEVYHAMGDYSKAVEFLEKSIKIFENALSLNPSTLATAYGNLASVYNSMGNHVKALEFHEKALKIEEKALPPSHLNLAISYASIGQVYSFMSDHSKALEFYEKAHKIFGKALPPNHPIWLCLTPTSVRCMIVEENT